MVIIHEMIVYCNPHTPACVTVIVWFCCSLCAWRGRGTRSASTCSTYWKHSTESPLQANIILGSPLDMVGASHAAIHMNRIHAIYQPIPAFV
eukprot:COSAG05_NODE_561_length_8675_cov_3.694846_10_plen_92_part_00